MKRTLPSVPVALCRAAFAALTLALAASFAPASARAESVFLRSNRECDKVSCYYGFIPVSFSLTALEAANDGNSWYYDSDDASRGRLQLDRNWRITASKVGYTNAWYTYANTLTELEREGPSSATQLLATGSYLDVSTVTNRLYKGASGVGLLYAVFTPVTYRLNYELNGGAWSEPASHPDTATYDKSFEVSAPVRDFHRFTGWKVNGKNYFTGESNVVTFVNLASTEGAEVTIGAQWDARSYNLKLVFTEGVAKIHYRTSDGAQWAETTSPLSVAVKYGENWSAWAEPAYGYEGDGTGWDEETPAGEAMTEKGAAFKPTAKKQSFALRLRVSPSDGGTVTGSATYEYLAQAELAATAAEGYRFRGWSDGSVENPYIYTVVSNVTLTARFAAKTCDLQLIVGEGVSTIWYRLQDADGDAWSEWQSVIASTTLDVPYGTRYQVYADAKDGYTFTGSGSSKGSAITGTLKTDGYVFEPKPTKAKYLVTVTSNPSEGGTVKVNADGRFEYGERAKVEANVNEGWIFRRWNDVSPEVTKEEVSSSPIYDFTVTDNVFLEAVFEKDSYKVTFIYVLANGSEYPDIQYVAHGESAVEPPAEKRNNWPGHVFTAWDSSEWMTVTRDMTIRAVYAAGGYTVHFDANGGTGTMSDQAFTCGQFQNLSAYAFERTGYVFDGWATNNLATTRQYKDEQSVKDLTTAGSITLYAVWSPITYTVVYEPGNKSGTAYEEYHKYDQEFQLPTSPFSSTVPMTGWKNGTLVYQPGETVSRLSSDPKVPVELVAQWGDGSQLRFDANWSGVDPNRRYRYQSFSNEVENALMANTWIREGYTFVGWSTDPEAKITTNTVRALTFKRVDSTLKVTEYETADGKRITAKRDLNEDTLILDQALATDPAAVGETLNLYAVWTPNTYQVIFDVTAYDSKGAGKTPIDPDSVQPQILTFDSEAYFYPKYSAGGKAREFLGWSTNGVDVISGTDATGGPLKNLTTVPGDHIRLYAIWKETASDITLTTAKLALTTARAATSAAANSWTRSSDRVVTDGVASSTGRDQKIASTSSSTATVSALPPLTAGDTSQPTWTIESGWQDLGSGVYTNASANAVLSATVSTPGTLTFYWMPSAVGKVGVNTELNRLENTQLSVACDSEALTNLTGQTRREWTSVMVAVDNVSNPLKFSSNAGNKGLYPCMLSNIVWTAKSYETQVDVKFVVDGEKGSCSGEAKQKVTVKTDSTGAVVEPGHVTSVPKVTAKDGWKFNGWTRNGELVGDVTKVDITADTTFTAAFSKAEYPKDVTVLFVVDSTKGSCSGETKQTVTVTNDYWGGVIAPGKVASVPTVLPKDNWQFTGWIDAVGKTNTSDAVKACAITNDTTFTAAFQSNVFEKKVEVTFKLDANRGGTPTNEFISVWTNAVGGVAVYGQATEPEVAGVNGWAHVGWLEGEDPIEKGKVQDRPIATNTTFTGVYERRIVVRFNYDATRIAYGSGETNQVNVTTNRAFDTISGVKVTPPTMNGTSNYSFEGWIDANGKTNTADKVQALELFTSTNFTAAYAEKSEPEPEPGAGTRTFAVTFALTNTTQGAFVGDGVFATKSEAKCVDLVSVTTNGAGTVTKHGTALEPTVVGLNGWDFAGWCDAAGGTNVAIDAICNRPITNNTTFTAVFEPHAYRVIYANVREHNHSNPATFVSPDGINLFTNRVSATEWTGRWNGAYTRPETIGSGYESAFTNWLPSAVNSGVYGYVDESTGVFRYTNVVTQAQWMDMLVTSDLEYRVTFVWGIDCETNETVTVKRGRNVVGPDKEVVDRAGYVFQGWDRSLDNVTDDFTTYAQYETIRYPLTYANLKGATHDNPLEYTVVNSITLRSPKNDNVNLNWLGWTTNGVQTAGIVAGTTGAIAFTANWAYRIAYTRTDAGHVETIAGQSSKKVDVYVGEASSGTNYSDHAGCTNAPSVTCAKGYSFAGWQVVEPADTASQRRLADIDGYLVDAAGNRIVAGMTISNVVEAMTLQAVATANVYVVAFKGGEGATGAMADQPFTYDVEQALTSNAFTKIGSSFAGWQLATDGRDQKIASTGDGRDQKIASTSVDATYADGAVVKNLATGGVVTLVAQWTALPTVYHTVTYAPGDNVQLEGSTEQRVAHGGTAIFPTVTVKAGYAFDGWFDDDKRRVSPDTVTNVTEDLSFTALATQCVQAVFHAVQVGALPEGGGDVALYDAAGRRIPSGTYLEGTNLTATATPAEGWLFARWQFVDATPSSRQDFVDANFCPRQNEEGSVLIGRDQKIASTKIASTTNFTVTGDVSLTAVFTQRVFAVTFELDEGLEHVGGGALAQSVAYGESPVAPEVEADDDYAFRGWRAPDGALLDAEAVGTYRVTNAVAFAAVVEDVQPRIEVKDFQAEYETKVAIAPIAVACADAEDATLKVTGLPTGLKFTAKDILDSKTKAVKVAANTIYGTPTRSGLFTAAVTATVSEKIGRKTVTTVVASTNLAFVVRADGETVVATTVAPVDGVVPGKTTGQGVYKVDKKVTLKATANKGYVFSGWYDSTTGLVTRAASYALVVPEQDVAFAARFVFTEDDAASISARVNGMAVIERGGDDPSAGVTAETNVTAGVYLEWPVAVDALSATTVSVSGLPTGLKFTAKDLYNRTTGTLVPAMTIYGTPTAGGKTSTVKVMVTTAGKNKVTGYVELTVKALPAWLVTTFTGGATGEGETAEPGSATLTVAKTGKVSGKWISEGLTWTLAAANLDAYDEATGEAVATATAKSGKLTDELTLVFAPTNVAAGATHEAATVGVAYAAEDATPSSRRDALFAAIGTDWKVEPWKSLAKDLKGETFVVASDDGTTLSGKVNANGAVSVKGEFDVGAARPYSATVSSVLEPLGADRFACFVCWPAKAAKAFGGYAAWIVLEWNGETLEVVP